MTSLASFTALLISAAILLGSNGLFGTLIAVAANIETFGATWIGALGSAFYLGFIAGCLFGPRIVYRAGHIRCFAAMAAIYAASALLHALIPSPWAWLVLRIVGGLCFACLTLVLESWLNAKSGNRDRGRVLSIYRLVDLSAVTAGQFVLTLADPRSYEIFSLVAMGFCLCLVPLALTRSVAPTPSTAPELDLKAVFAVSPLATLGVFGVGLVNGTFRMLSPTVALDYGLNISEIAWLISAFVAGGALLQYPFGALSDRFDRRSILMVATALAMCASASMGMFAQQGAFWLIAGSFLFGGFAVPIYSLAVSHANDFAKEDQFVQLSASLFLVFGIGAVVGPFLGSTAIELFGRDAFFYYLSAAHGILLLFAIWRTRRRATVPKDSRRGFVALLRTSPAIFRLDPRSRRQK